MLTPALQSPFFSAKDTLRGAVMALQRAHIETASLDARLLLQHVLSVSREQLLADNGLMLTSQQDAAYQELIEKRIRRQPVAQLIGRREFWGRIFKVTEATLDPRPDSETLIATVLDKFRDRSQALRLLDLGTGTGCLLLTLLKEYNNAKGIGVDISEDALNVARENAVNLGLQERAIFIHSCWCEKVHGTFDIIVANPPYIPTAGIAGLAPEVAKYEPRQALDGGEDGLDPYRVIMPSLKRLLAPEGLAVLEMGFGQQLELETIAKQQGLNIAGVKEDMAGIARCILLQDSHTHHH